VPYTRLPLPGDGRRTDRTGPVGLEALCDELIDLFGKDKDDDIALLAADLTPGAAAPAQ